MNNTISRQKETQFFLSKKQMFFFLIAFVLFICFLFIVQPAGIYNMDSQKNKITIIFLLALNFIIFQLIEFTVIRRRKSFNNNNNEIKIHVLFSVIIILATILILYLRHPFMTKMHFYQYLFSTVFIVGIFQLSIFLMLKKIFFTESPSFKSKPANKILINDNKTTLNIDVNEVVFIKSEGNYVEVFEKDKKYLIRTTLKKIIEQNKQPEFIRCHKSYIVNLNKIKRITGNSKGYKLFLTGYKEPIPASPKTGNKIKEKLTSLSSQIS